MPSFFPNSNSFGVFSHSKGFGAEWLFASLWFSGADPSWASKRFRRRFHAKVPPTPKFSSFQSLYGSLGQIRRGRFNQGSTKEGQGSTKVPRFSGANQSWASKRFHQGSTKEGQGSTKVPRFSGADQSWASKRFRGRFHRGSTKEGQGSTEVPQRFHQEGQGSTKVTPKFSSFQSLYGSLGQIGRGRFHQGSTKEGQGSTEVPPRKAKVPARFHRGPTKVTPRFSSFQTL